MHKKCSILAAIFILTCNGISAGSCELNVTRQACPQKEEFSYRKCGGQPTCTFTTVQLTEEQCLERALSACENPFPLVTKQKQITAKFNGNELRGSDGSTDICHTYQQRTNKYNQC